MMENVIGMAMQTCQTYAEKMKTHGLAEFELMMYDQCCRMVQTYAEIQCKIGQIQMLAADRALVEETEKQEKWEKNRNARDIGGNSKAQDGNGGVDPECGGAPVPVG
jgi:hypothetical protein